MPGPAPDPNALRRDRNDDKGTWTTLPAAGRAGGAPAWPLTRASSRELDQWTREWARPQAVMWERDGQTEEVALYVRTLIRSEGKDADPRLLVLVVRHQEALGLSQPGLMRRRWKIEDAPQPKTRGNDSTDRRSAKTRFRTIEGGAAKAS